jgi:hypothetical protein
VSKARRRCQGEGGGGTGGEVVARVADGGRAIEIMNVRSGQVGTREILAAGCWAEGARSGQ